MINLNKGEYILYLLAPSEFSKKFYINPKKHLLGIIVDGTGESNRNLTTIPPPVISLTEKGWGVSFIFESHLKWHSPVPEIDTYSFGENKVMSDFVAAYRKGSYLSSYAREFISIAGKLYT